MQSQQDEAGSHMNSGRQSANRMPVASLVSPACFSRPSRACPFIANTAGIERTAIFTRFGRPVRQSPSGDRLVNERCQIGAVGFPRREVADEHRTVLDDVHLARHEKIDGDVDRWATIGTGIERTSARSLNRPSFVTVFHSGFNARHRPALPHRDWDRADLRHFLVLGQEPRNGAADHSALARCRDPCAISINTRLTAAVVRSWRRSHVRHEFPAADARWLPGPVHRQPKDQGGCGRRWCRPPRDRSTAARNMPISFGTITMTSPFGEEERFRRSGRRSRPGPSA